MVFETSLVTEVLPRGWEQGEFTWNTKMLGGVNERGWGDGLFGASGVAVRNKCTMIKNI